MLEKVKESLELDNKSIIILVPHRSKVHYKLIDNNVLEYLEKSDKCSFDIIEDINTPNNVFEYLQLVNDMHTIYYISNNNNYDDSNFLAEIKIGHKIEEIKKVLEEIIYIYQ
ncbi:hypothetical protein EOM09_07405 [bacterium]|nr:hypothetical protein [bacterium]